MTKLTLLAALGLLALVPAAAHAEEHMDTAAPAATEEAAPAAVEGEAAATTEEAAPAATEGEEAPATSEEAAPAEEHPAE